MTTVGVCSDLVASQQEDILNLAQWPPLVETTKINKKMLRKGKTF